MNAHAQKGRQDVRVDSSAAAIRLLPPSEARRCGCGKPNTTGLCAYPLGKCPREQSAAASRFQPGDRVGYESVIGGWVFGEIAAVVKGGYRVTWDDDYDDSATPPYSDAELTAYADVPEDERV